VEEADSGQPRVYGVGFGMGVGHNLLLNLYSSTCRNILCPKHQTLIVRMPTMPSST